MNKQLNLAVCTLATILTATSVGCSNGFKSGSGNSATNGATSVTPAENGAEQVAKAQAAVDDSQKALNSASTALSGMSKSNGGLDLSIFLGGSGGVLAPIIAELQPVFDQAYAKVVAVKQQFDASKAAIAAQIATLDPADPAAVLLTQELTALTDMETNFDNQVHMLADKLGLVNAQIDGLILQITAQIPIPGIGVIAGILIDTFVVNDVKALITDLQTKLMSL